VNTLAWLTLADADARRDYFALLSASALVDFRRALLHIADWQPALHGPLVREIEMALAERTPHHALLDENPIRAPGAS
jgi:recombinational DNA repair protein (RecF pathway)